jgi:hypothetical protein
MLGAVASVSEPAQHRLDLELARTLPTELTFIDTVGREGVERGGLAKRERPAAWLKSCRRILPALT